MAHFLSGASGTAWPLLKWLLVGAAWAGGIYILYGQRLRVRDALRRESPTSESARMLVEIERRDAVLWLALLSLLTLAAFLLPHLRSTIAVDHASRPAAIAPTPPAPLAAPSFSTHRAAMPYSDIPEFAESRSREQAYLDWVKRRYESWLVTFYYLHHCQAAPAEDLARIGAALDRDLALAQAEPGLRDNVLLAASGSYQEMYATVPCDPERLRATKSLYDANMQQLQTLSRPGTAPGAGSAIMTLPEPPAR